MMPPGEVLEWDSRFWNRRIAQVDRFDGAVAGELEAWVEANGIDCLYLRIPVDSPELVHVAEDLRFRLMDVRYELAQRLDGDKGARDGRTREATSADVDALARIAHQVHRGGRFFADPRMPDERCADLYAEWIRASCRGWADVVLVADADGEPAGYCTGHFDEDAGRIGLIGVRADQQRGNVGSALLTDTIDRFAAAGLSHARVATAADNHRALLFYERHGFRMESVQLTFHRWSDGDHG
jgi:ribosomal protein S18 acetylase RimI-like enzyme